jgi:serine/threonine-protein kinase
VARNYNSLGITAWERGDLSEALRALAHAVAIWRQGTDQGLLAAGLFNQAMVLHEAGFDADALPLLRESRRLRMSQFGAEHGLVGDTDRLIGIILAAQGNAVAARGALQSAVRLTRAGYGPTHSHTLRAELSQARLLAAEDDPNALRRLGEISVLSGDDSELRKGRWLASAYLAERRCASTPELARAELDSLLPEMQARMPEGGAVLREVQAIRTACL